MIILTPLLCDKEYLTWPCLYHSVQLKEYSHNELLSTIENIDTDPSIRRIVISLKNSSSLDPSTLGNSLDSFLTPRPWWHVIREPFNWQKHLKKEVVLERLGTDWEPYFRYLTTFHFPVQEVCRKSTLLVGRAACVHPGWFSALSFYRMTFSAHPYAITVSYYPELVDRPNNNAWVSFKGTVLYVCMIKISYPDGFILLFLFCASNFMQIVPPI
jgi:hypothetical protein